MQVSWIDSDQLKGLLERLGDSVPQAKPGTQTWETHTMPAAAEREAGLSGEEGEVSVSGGSEGAWGAAVTEGAVPQTGVAVPVEPDEGEEAEPMEGAKPEEVAPEVARIRDRLREVRERAEAAGLLKRAVPAMVAPVVAPILAPVVEEVAAVTEAAVEAVVSGVEAAAGQEVESEVYFEVPVGSVVERVEAFSQWARRRLSAGEVVLLDEHGDVLWGAQAKGALILSAMLAANALSRSSAAGACQAERGVVRQVLSSGSELAVLSCDTQAGLIHLAVEHPTERLTESEMRLLGQALVSAIAAGT